jgi:predicted TIM-barrel fold metal-dependent hydrolase
MAMTIVDFFVHAIAEKDEAALFDLEGHDLDALFDTVTARARDHGVDHSVIHFFDERVLDRPAQSEAILTARDRRDLSFFCLLDPRTKTPEQRVEAALRAGMRGICFHPYLQDIARDSYPPMADLARLASDAGLLVGVCAAYGSRDVYRISPLEALVACAEACGGPVIALHGGGAKIVDAIVIADAFENVFLETSFSLPYWLGSSVETDFAAAIRKLGADRVLFGSDAPFCDRETALSAHRGFFEKHEFSADDVATVMGARAQYLLKD